jgi:hypothetical protein
MPSNAGLGAVGVLDLAAPRERGWWRSKVGVAVTAMALAIALVSATQTAQAFTTIGNGDIIASLANGQVNEYTPTGSLVQTLISNANLPTGSAFDGQGNLYVTEFESNDILKVDGTTGAVSVFSNDSSLADGTVFNSPESIAFGPGFTKMYVSDANRFGTGGGIHVIDPATGKGIGFLPLPSSNGSGGVGESDWLALDANASLFMTNENPAQGIMQVNQSTGDIVSPSFAGNLPNFGYAMSYDPSGNLWLSDTDRILEFSPSGSLLRAITNPSFSVVFAGVFNPPFNTIYAGDIQTGNIFSYDLNGNLTGSFNVHSGIDGLSVAGTTLPGTGGGPQDVQVTPHNGSVHVTWQPPATGANLVTGYEITATPSGNDRLPAPNAGAVVQDFNDPTKLSTDIQGLVEDCHQLYTISVAALNGTAVGPTTDSSRVRPSGIVEPGQDPPYVVILVDGINSKEPGFTDDPYKPSSDNPSGYCPESFTTSGTFNQANFFHTSNGPWSFFHKWQYGEIDDSGNPTGKNPDGGTQYGGNSESLPRARANADEGNTQGVTPAATETHAFMLDAIAAKGAIILNFSYKGGAIGRNRFVFNAYSACDSAPGGSVVADSPSCPLHTPSIQSDAVNLASEVSAASAQWPTSKIVILAHSQGGLIAFTYWACAHSNLPGIINDQYCKRSIRTGPLPPNFVGAFSMDSPITGGCGLIEPFCVGPPSYPDYRKLHAVGTNLLPLEGNGSQPFYFIGTFGDSPAKEFLGVGVPGYQTGAEELQHQLLFNYDQVSSHEINDRCHDSLNEGGCPIVRPWDHISECPVADDADNDQDDTINGGLPPFDLTDGLFGNPGDGPNLVESWEEPHFVEKYCPGNVRFFNSKLGLSY